MIAQTIRASILLALIITLIITSGCAFGTRQPTLVYPPKEETSNTGVAYAATPSVQHQNKIVLQPFTDQRTDKKLVGTVRNTFGMRTADVIPANNVATWVTDAVKIELEANGYDVLGKTPDGVENGQYATVSGEILNVFCDMYLSYTGQVSLIVKASKEGTVLLNKSYSGEGSAGLAWAMTEESYSQSLALALASALKQFVADLDQHVE